jgi:cell division initiation protein
MEDNMKITPIDIQQAGFRIRFRGYDRQEVDAFLDSVTEEYEGLIRENHSLREKATDFEGQVIEFRKKEAQLTNALMKAEELMEGMKHSAQKEAALIVKEAELKAEEMTRMAREEIATLQRGILDLKKQKMITLEKFRSIINTFQKIIDLEDREEDRAGSAKAS